MLRKFLFAIAGAGAVSLAAAAVPAPAHATSLHVGSLSGAFAADTNVIEVQRDRRRASRRGPPRGHRYHGHYRGGFWAAPFAMVAPHPCYRYSHARRGWVWDYRRCAF